MNAPGFRPAGPAPGALSTPPPPSRLVGGPESEGPVYEGDRGAPFNNTLGKYRLVAELARGAMGIVYLGMAQGPAGFSKLLVIKELRPDAAEDPEFLRMFLDEARLAARLNHANIVQTYEVDGDRSRYFMAMEHLEGQTLRRLLDLARKPGPGPKPSRAMLLRVLSEVLSGLHHAHELCDFDGTPLGVVHRDVSPKNVFLTYDGRAKLMDFGIAKAKDALHVTVAGMLKGKVTYMAPEQAQNLPVDRRADVFAAGVVLWEMLVGRKLWEKVPLNEVLLRLSRHDLPPAPSVLVADLPSELDRICARAMAPARDDRYPTALEFREDLERYLSDSGDEVHPREVGQFVASAFAEERQARRALVEAAVRGLAGPEGGEIAQLMGPDQRESVGRIRAAPPSALGGNGPYVPPGASPPHGIPFNPLPAPVVAPSTPPPTSPPKRWSPLFIAFAVLGSLASAAFGARFAMRAERGLGAPKASAEATTSASPALLALTLKVTPPQAHVFLDDAELPPEAWSGMHPRDGRPHRVRAEAEGYLPHSQVVVFAEPSLSLPITLDKRPAEPAPPAASAPPPPASSAAPAASALPRRPRPPAPRASEPASTSAEVPPRVKPKRRIEPLD